MLYRCRKPKENQFSSLSRPPIMRDCAGINFSATNPIAGIHRAVESCIEHKTKLIFVTDFFRLKFWSYQYFAFGALDCLDFTNYAMFMGNQRGIHFRVFLALPVWAIALELILAQRTP